MPDLRKKTTPCIVLVSIFQKHFSNSGFFQETIGEIFVAQLFEIAIKMETTQQF